MARRFTPRPLDNLSDDDLRDYLRACAETIRRNGPAIEKARDDFNRLSRERLWTALRAYGGVAAYGIGLATTPVTGGLSAALAVAGGLFAADSFNTHYSKGIKRATLRIDIENIEASDIFCRAEQKRICEMLRRRRLD